ncbi:MAG: HDIG domain-containing protein [Deltaproteobacteria bacterium]|nr:HDIG domain-containing protein [Deltaproteobacteria bacterium]MBW2340096.1 HDIG domain-containing protein [Deltaproteobacteria bacterium]
MGIALKGKVPSIDKCYKLLKRYHVPDHIVQHSKTVCRVAVLLAEELNEQGENLSIPEIQAAALLHDVTKMEGLNRGQDHAKTGKEFLVKIGFQKIGEIVAEHIKLQEGRNSPLLSEEEIINYSDKRVMHTKVVSLAERFSDLRKRYGRGGMDKNAMQRISTLEHKTYNLEKRIFAKLDFTPHELLDLVDKALAIANNHHAR